ncbi:MauE/DoxX family redox-associated membrane protein [Actinoallomurus sp. NPDC052308]|uniref:MauE/DoxX family redox-associated membrane protein n=1 Tax=Actinoallomurus sp. NPDC052308 TaxID=3155530 RepID=UPI0034226487
MAAMLTGVSAGTVALILLAGFAGHLLHPRVLPAALTAHRTVPAPLIWPVAVAVGALEGVLGAVTGYALLAGRPRALTLGATGSALLFVAYALYGLYVLRTRPSGRGRHGDRVAGAENRAVPCGCSADDTPMSGWVAGRAAALALASVTASAGAGSAIASHGVHVALVGLSSVTFAVLLWSLPTAMADPERSVAG